jgi:hypothetical protein
VGGAELRSAPATAGVPSATMTGMRVRQWWCAGNSTSMMDKVSYSHRPAMHDTQPNYRQE